MTLMMSGSVQEYDDNPKKMMILNKDIRSQKKHAISNVID